MEESFNIAMRVLHIGSAIALLGGTFFFLLVMLPAVRVIDEGLRGAVLQAARKRFYRVTHPALLILLATGLYAYLARMDEYRAASKAVHGLIGAKIILWLFIAVVVFAQSFGVLKGCPVRWAKINATMGVAIIILAAIARSMRMGGIQ